MVEEPEIGGPDQNELVIALVAAVGTDVGMVADELAIELRRVRLRQRGSAVEQLPRRGVRRGLLQAKKFDEALWDAMSAGDTLRNKWGRGDALALHAISDIVAIRKERTGVTRTPVRPVACSSVPASTGSRSSSGR